MRDLESVTGFRANGLGIIPPESGIGRTKKNRIDDLRSPDVMLRRLLVPQSVTRFIWPIGDADGAQMHGCILMYRSVPRKSGGIRFLASLLPKN